MMNVFTSWRRTAAALLVVMLTSAGCLVATAGAASAANGQPFSIGTWDFQPREVKHFWRSTTSYNAYAAGLTPTALTTGSYCSAEVSRTWYERGPSGDLQFHMEVRGADRDPCRITVWLVGLTSFRSSSLGDLAPGASVTRHWNNAHSDQYIYQVGAILSQPGDFGTCRVEVSTHYRTQPSGENEFYYTTTNIGAATCSVTLSHVRLPVQWNSGIEYNPGGGLPFWPPRSAFSASAKVFIAGAVPEVNPNGVCRYDIHPVSYSSGNWVTAWYAGSQYTVCDVASTWTAL